MMWSGQALLGSGRLESFMVLLLKSIAQVFVVSCLLRRTADNDGSLEHSLVVCLRQGHNVADQSLQ